MEAAELKAQQVSVEREELETEPKPKGILGDIPLSRSAKTGTAVILDEFGQQETKEISPDMAIRLHKAGRLHSFKTNRDPLLFHTGEGTYLTGTNVSPDPDVELEKSDWTGGLGEHGRWKEGADIKGAHPKTAVGTAVYNDKGDEFKIDEIKWVSHATKRNLEKFPGDTPFHEVKGKIRQQVVAGGLAAHDRVVLYKIDGKWYNHREAANAFRMDKPFEWKESD